MYIPPPQKNKTKTKTIKFNTWNIKHLVEYRSTRIHKSLYFVFPTFYTTSQLFCSLLWLNWLWRVCVSAQSQTLSLCSPLFLYSAVASQWKPHHAISSPHWFLLLQNCNHSLTAPVPPTLRQTSCIPISVLFTRQCKMQDFSPFTCGFNTFFSPSATLKLAVVQQHESYCLWIYLTGWHDFFKHCCKMK